MKITKRQLRRIIREAIDVVNRETGEVIDFGDNSLSGMPDEAVPDLVQRLGLSLSSDDTLSNNDWKKLEAETLEKQDRRADKRKSAQMATDRERLNIDNLLKRLDQWAADAGDDWTSDRMGGNQELDLQDVAYDLADNAKYEFQEDEWDELVWHFDDNEDDLRSYIIGAM